MFAYRIPPSKPAIGALLLCLMTHGTVPAQNGAPAAVPIASLRSLPPDLLSHVTVQGAVTRTGTPSFLQDRSGGIEVVLPAETQARIGDELVVSGRATPGRYSFRLAADSVHLDHARTPSPPLAITPMMAASGHYDRVLIDTEGTLLSEAETSGGVTVLLLQGNRQVFAVQLSGRPDRLATWKRGSLLRIRGVCIMNESATHPATAFHVLLRSEQDVTVLAGPPFWTRGHVLVMVLVGLLLACIALLLQRRFERWRFRLILDERTRLAHDLHDTLAQSFAGIGFQLQAIRSALRRQRSASEIDNHVTLAIGMVSHSHQDARRAIAMLRPTVPGSEGDLMQQLRDQAEALTQGGAIRIVTGISGESRPVPPKAAHALLGIGHEAITNAVRHASPGTISLLLKFGDDAVSLSVEDDGRGFLYKRELLRGFGLDGMHARAASCGGSIRISSTVGCGSLIHAELPLHPKRSPVSDWFKPSSRRAS